MTTRKTSIEQRNEILGDIKQAQWVLTKLEEAVKEGDKGMAAYWLKDLTETLPSI